MPRTPSQDPYANLDPYFYDIAIVSRKTFGDIYRFAIEHSLKPIPNSRDICELDKKKTLTLIRMLEISYKREIKKTNEDYEEFTKGLSYEGVFTKICVRFLSLNDILY